ncbi:hypothetical protein FKM82_024904 [Ascaphus truei]
MGSQPIDPHELLKGLDCFLGRDGEVKAMEGMAKIFNLMKESRKLVSRCIYLNIVLQTHSPDTLSKFIRVGGYKLLNNWLTYARTSNNSPLLHQILLTLQHLPLTVNHLKQNNTAKLVKQLSKGSDDAEVRKLACVLVGDWMAVIRSQSNIQPADKDKKKKKEDPKSRSPVPDKAPEVKAESRVEELADRKKEKPKIQRTTAPSHAKFRSTGLEVEAPSIAPIKKSPTIPVISDKYNLKPIPVKRQSSIPGPGDAPPAEKKYKPLNTTPNTTKEIKVKIIPPQPMESLGFLDALNSAPITGIKIKKKKKAVSPTNNKGSQGNAKTEDLMKQPDFSDKIKQLLGTLQSQSQGPPLPVVPPGLLGPPPLGNGYPPPDPTNPPPLQQPPPMQPPPHYPPPGPPGPFPGPHGPPPGAPPGGPRMMGPPPPQRDGYWEPPPSENMRGGHHGDRGGMRGGGERGPPPPPFHRSRGGREPGYRGRGDRGPPGGGRNGPHGMEHDGEHRGHGGEHHRGHGGEHRGHGGEHRDRSDRPVCRHFIMKGNCRYENNCAFYHPGVNGPHLL